MARSQGTAELARARVKTCKRHPSGLAVGKLAGIAGNPGLPAVPRIDAASTLLARGEQTAAGK